MWLKPCSKETYKIRQLKQTAIYNTKILRMMQRLPFTSVNGL